MRSQQQQQQQQQQQRRRPEAALTSSAGGACASGAGAKIYLAFGLVLCLLGLLVLVVCLSLPSAAAAGSPGTLWVGPLVSGVGLLLLAKGGFDQLRAYVKASAQLPESDDSDVESPAGRRLRLLLPFGRRRNDVEHFKYLTTDSSTDSWATASRRSYQHVTLQPPPKELVQNASLLLDGSQGGRRRGGRPAPPSIRTSLTSSCGHHEPVYFPVLSTSTLPTVDDSPYPSVFSLQDTPDRGGLGRPKHSAASAPNLLLAAPASGKQGRLPGRQAQRLASHLEEA